MGPRPVAVLVSIGAILSTSLTMPGAGYASAAPTEASPPQRTRVDAELADGPREPENWRWYESGRFYRGDARSAPKSRTLDGLRRTSQETIVPGLVHSQYDNGVVEADVLEADLTESTLSVEYVAPEHVAAREPLSTQARDTGVVAATNGDFFDIGDSGAPRGAGIVDGRLRHAPADGWNEGVVFSRDQDASVGRLADILLDAVATLPSGDTLTIGNLNSPNVATDGIGIYTPEWGNTARSRTVDGATSVREVQLENGVVTAVRTSAGADPVPAEGLVLLGRGAGANELAGLVTGDRVEVEYRADYEGAEAYAGITGSTTLLRDGDVVAPEHPRHPRTGVGFSADGGTMWLVALDGRSDASTGMTLVEFAEFLGSLGAYDALNLDGGGSTTMVAMMPGDTELSVQNRPSDGSERTVPNGLGFSSTAYPPNCVRAALDSTTYEVLGEGDTGAMVLVAECLLKAAGQFDPAPGSAYDADTVAAVEAFQQDRGITVTGTVDASTWTALLSAGATPTLQDGSSGLAVKRVQRALNAAIAADLTVDGLFGPATDAAVRDYQRSRGLGVDGIVGPNTWDALQHGR